MPNSMVYKNYTISDPIEIANAFNDYFINVDTNITLSNMCTKSTIVLYCNTIYKYHATCFPFINYGNII